MINVNKLLVAIFLIFETTFFSNLLLAQKDSVPGVVITKGQFERIIVVRLKTNTDLLEGLKKAAEIEKINNAVILAGIGSVSEYSVHSVKTTTFPTENIFLKEKGPFDILNVTGYIFTGRIHAHITLTDLKKTIGGHLEPGTMVYTFAIITIGILSDNVKMENFDNWKWH
jgi:predicted DNA-binding protein with PD1-like motif